MPTSSLCRLMNYKSSEIVNETSCKNGIMSKATALVSTSTLAPQMERKGRYRTIQTGLNLETPTSVIRGQAAIALEVFGDNGRN